MYYLVRCLSDLWVFESDGLSLVVVQGIITLNYSPSPANWVPEHAEYDSQDTSM
jgi:hypothetical protein